MTMNILLYCIFSLLLQAKHVLAASSIEASLYTESDERIDNFYYVDITVASIKLSVPVVFDTASADLWIDQRMFDVTESETYRSNGTTGKIEYTGSNVSGIWGVDTFEIGGVEIANVSFLSVNVSDADVMGVLGVGYQYIETTFANEGYLYDTLPMLMVDQGLIDERIYSINLNDGNVIFGTTDYGTDVIYFDNQNILIDQPTEAAISMSGLNVAGDEIDIGGTAIVVFDTGSTWSAVPDYLYDRINKALGAEYDSNTGYYLFQCVKNNNGDEKGNKSDISLAFEFGNSFNVTFDLADFQIVIDADSQLCWTGIYTTGLNDSYYLLGDDFLKNVLFVVDQHETKIGLATLRETTTTSIVSSTHEASSTYFINPANLSSTYITSSSLHSTISLQIQISETPTTTAAEIAATAASAAPKHPSARTQRYINCTEAIIASCSASSLQSYYTTVTTGNLTTDNAIMSTTDSASESKSSDAHVGITQGLLPNLASNGVVPSKMIPKSMFILPLLLLTML